MTLDAAIEKAAALIEAMPYVRSFQDKVVVVKFGGAAMESDEAMENVLADVVFMELVNMRPILVHGGGPFITAEMKKRGKEPSWREGHRVTDAETLEIAKEVLVNQVNRRIVQKINVIGGRATGTWEACPSLLTAEKQFFEAKDNDGNAQLLDVGFVGRVTSVDTDQLRQLLQGGCIPVIPPLGSGGSDIFNIQADVVATAVASAMKAEKLVFLSNTHGIMTDPPDASSFASSLHEAEVHRLIDQGIIDGGMLPKARACIDALRAGVGKAHIIDGRIPHSLLLEIFTDRGIGTEIVM